MPISFFGIYDQHLQVLVSTASCQSLHYATVLAMGDTQKLRGFAHKVLNSSGFLR